MNLLLLAFACAHTPEVPVIDLSKPPAVQPAPDYSPPVPTQHELSNGAKVWIHAQSGLPLVSLRLVVPGGAAADPSEQPGMVSLADAMLIRGAGERNATDFAIEVERLALELGTDTLGTATIVSMDAHTDRLEAGFRLLSDMVLRPNFNEDDLQRLKEIRVGELTEAADDAKTIAGWTIDERYFGSGHPFAHPTEGNRSSIEGAAVEDVRTSWDQRFGPEVATFVIAGDVSPESVLPQLEKHFSEWKRGERVKRQIPAPKIHTGPNRFFFVDKPGTAQTALRVMMPAPTMYDAKSTPAELGAIVLGGTFTSRLNTLLREEKGYTYGARASYVGRHHFGYLTASTNVQKEVSAMALHDLLSELKRYASGIEPNELRKAQGAWQTRAVSAMESRASVSSSFAGLAVLELPVDSYGVELKAAKTTNITEVNQAIQSSDIENAVVVVVGDLKEIQTEIETAVPAEWQVVQTIE